MTGRLRTPALILAGCAIAAVGLVVWVVTDPTPALDGRALLALLVAAVALRVAGRLERGAR